MYICICICVYTQICLHACVSLSPPPPCLPLSLSPLPLSFKHGSSQKRHTIAPTWLSPLVRGLEGKPATAGGALDGKGKVGATTAKMGAAGSGGKPVRASSRQRAGATTERADTREPPSKRVRTQGGRQAEDGEVSQEALGDGLLDDSLGIRFWRLSNGVRVTYKHTAFEAGQVVIKVIVSRRDA